MPVTVEVPESVEAVVGALGDGAVVIAGGTQVMPRLNTEAHGIEALVSLRRAGLAGIDVDGTRPPRVGAATTLAAVGADERLAFLRPGRRVDRLAVDPQPGHGRRQPVRRPALRRPRRRAARARRARPTSPATGAATRAGRGARRRRVCPPATSSPPSRFALAADVPLPQGDAPPAELGLDRHRRRRADRRRTAPSAAARIALGGAGAAPVRAPSAEAALIGGPLDAERAEAAGRAALDDTEPFTDAYASAWYRSRVLPVHLRRALIGQRGRMTVTRHRAHGQRASRASSRHAGHDAAVRAARPARPDRRQARLRAGHLRHLHRACSTASR